MKKQGKVVRWDEQRGFGFIRCEATSQDIFFHIRDCLGGIQPPINATVEFEEIHMGGKGPRAMAVRAAQYAVQPMGQPTSRQPSGRAPSRRPVQAATRRESSTPSLSLFGVGGLTLIWSALLTWGVLQHLLPLLTWGLALGINAVTFYVYWLDKHAARKGGWRTAEKTLHLFGLIGGWPGARFAQQVLRHKSSKQSFQIAYWGTVWLHLTVLSAYLFWHKLAPLLH